MIVVRTETVKLGVCWNESSSGTFHGSASPANCVPALGLSAGKFSCCDSPPRLMTSPERLFVLLQVAELRHDAEEALRVAGSLRINEARDFSVS